MNNFVISLVNATNRREHITNEFGKQNIPFEFFDAVTPKALKETANFLQIDLNKNTNLSENELSCLCSHICLWKKAIDENMDYINIFEDDIYLSKNAHLFLNHNDWIQSDWGFIKLEKTIEKALLKNPISLQDNHKIYLLKSVHIGAGGYILSKEIAKKLYDHFLTLGEIDHSDQYLFKIVLEENITPIYQINPVLCVQDCILYPNNQKFSSYLEWRDNQIKDKLTPTQKFMRELKRPFQQLKDQLQQTPLEFKQ